MSNIRSWGRECVTLAIDTLNINMSHGLCLTVEHYGMCILWPGENRGDAEHERVMTKVLIY